MNHKSMGFKFFIKFFLAMWSYQLEYKSKFRRINGVKHNYFVKINEFFLQCYKFSRMWHTFEEEEEEEGGTMNLIWAVVHIASISLYTLTTDLEDLQ